MARMRARSDLCTRCGQTFTVHVDLDAQEVKFVLGFDKDKCVGRNKVACIENMRDKALLARFEEGKVRQGF